MSTVLTLNEIMESDVNDSSFDEHQNITLQDNDMTPIPSMVVIVTADNTEIEQPTPMEVEQVVNRRPNTNNNNNNNNNNNHELLSTNIIDSTSSNDSINDISSSSSASASSGGSGCGDSSKRAKKSVLFDTVTVYHFTRSQGFSSIPSQGGSTLGMKRRHFLRRKLSVDLFEEVRRRSRREILLKIRFDKTRPKKSHDVNCNELNCRSSASSMASSTSSTTSTTSSVSTTSNNVNTLSLSSSSSSATSSSDSDESFSDYSDISDSELENDSYIFVQPIGVKLRRSLLRASGVSRIDPSEKWECKLIRDSRDRSGCSCVNQCVPDLCECIRSGVNCHVDRISYPCGCISEGCRNPQGRTEFDVQRVKGHLSDTLFKSGIG